MSYRDPSMMSVASWLPSAIPLLRAEAASHRDLDDLHYSTLAHLAQLIRLAKPRTKFIKQHGVRYEIERALAVVERFIQDTLVSLIGSDCDDARSELRQSLDYLRSEATKIYGLRKKFPMTRNSAKRSSIISIGNIFSSILQRASKPAVVSRHCEARSGHKRIASA